MAKKFNKSFIKLQHNETKLINIQKKVLLYTDSFHLKLKCIAQSNYLHRIYFVKRFYKSKMKWHNIDQIIMHVFQ
jgi:hypothetical protein